ncbi:MAG: S-methyl-5'-thioinosine phosphorylase [Pseudomonadota bacterium]
MLALIGGSGLEQLEGLAVDREHALETPWGQPSATIREGRFAGYPVCFLSRHGDQHQWPPHRINYRANIHALKQLGVDEIIAVAAVGGLTGGYPPAGLGVPDQIIDYTWGRGHTFSDGEGEVQHIDFTRPYSERLRRELLAAASACEVPLHDGGTYAATQGPRLESAAEVRRLIRDGADLVGMTGMPEAALAREVGINYASLAVVANRGAGLEAGELTMDEIFACLQRGLASARAVLIQLLQRRGEPRA